MTKKNVRNRIKTLYESSPICIHFYEHIHVHLMETNFSFDWLRHFPLLKKSSKTLCPKGAKGFFLYNASILQATKSHNLLFHIPHQPVYFPHRVHVADRHKLVEFGADNLEHAAFRHLVAVD